MGRPALVRFAMTTPVPISEPRLAPSVLLGEKISTLRRKQVGVAVGTGAGMAAGALVLLLGLAMLLDYGWIARWARGR